MSRYKNDEYRDWHNKQYRKKHRNDNVSEHGKLMRRYYAKTTRASRADERAKRQAIKDITQYLIATKQVDPQHVTEQMRWFFE